jgi:AAHS family 4-hydroxybenzoate transporter-like MFS transporter
MQSVEAIDIAQLLERQRMGSFQFMVIALVCVMTFVEGYDMQVMAFAAPGIIRSWHLNRASFGPVFGLGLFGYMLGATVLSNLADRLGRRRLIIGGGLLFAVSTLGAALSTDLRQLIALRFVAGIGLGAAVPSAIALAAEYAPARARATTVAVLFTFYNLGSTVGGLLAARLIPTFGWPAVFYVGGLLPLGLCAAFFWVLPESLRYLALQRGSNAGIAQIAGRILYPQVVAPGACFVFGEEQRAGVPVIHLFTGGRALMTVLLWTAFVSSLLGHTFLTSWLPTVLTGEGMSLAHADVSAALLQFGGVVITPLMGWLLDRKGIRSLTWAFALSVPLIVLIGSLHSADILLMLVVFLTGVGILGGQNGLNALSGTIYPTYIRATGSGWALGIGRIGSILGPVIGGVLIGLNQSPERLFFYAALPFLLCAVLCLFLRPAPTDAAAVESATSLVNAPDPG